MQQSLQPRQHIHGRTMKRTGPRTTQQLNKKHSQSIMHQATKHSQAGQEPCAKATPMQQTQHKQQQFQQVQQHIQQPMQLLQPAIAGPHPSWRLELFFKSTEELRSQLPFLRRFGLLRLNITNKAAEDDLIATMAELTAGLLPTQPLSTHQQQHQQQQQQQQEDDSDSQPEAVQGGSHPAGTTVSQLDVCLHYSLKYNYDKTPERSFERLMGFCRDLQSLQQQQQLPAAPDHNQQQQQQKTWRQQQLQSLAGSGGSLVAAAAVAAAADGVGAAGGLEALNVHVLLVSGGGKKKRFDTVAALQALAQHQQTQQHAHITGRTSGSGSGRSNGGSGSSGSVWLPSFAVAFNPYLPVEADAAEERRRLRSKLETGLVDRVYLQMGTDLQRLQAALDFFQQTVQQLTQEQPGFKAPQLLGSVFLPSKRLLAQMKFRPWNGVFLSDEYLSSVEAAERITAQLLDVYAAAGVVPLLESAVKTEQELQNAVKLLSQQ